MQDAMIFAAGLGLRMRPLTKSTPKPLIGFNGKKLVDHSINMLDEAGIKNKVINCFYLPEQIKSHFNNRNDIKIIEEKERLETGGGLKNALGLFKEKNVITLNSDVVFKYKNNPVKKLIDNWNEKNHDILMLLTKKENIFGYRGNGDFGMDKNGYINKEKKDYIYTGLQIINTKIIEDVEKNIFSLSEIFTKCLSNGRLQGILHEGMIFHIGDIEALKEAEELADS